MCVLRPLLYPFFFLTGLSVDVDEGWRYDEEEEEEEGDRRRMTVVGRVSVIQSYI